MKHTILAAAALAALSTPGLTLERGVAWELQNLTAAAKSPHKCKRLRAGVTAYTGTLHGPLNGYEGPHKCTLYLETGRTTVSIQEGGHMSYCISPIGAQSVLPSGGLHVTKRCRIKKKFGIYMASPLEGHASGGAFTRGGKRLNFKIKDASGGALVFKNFKRRN